VIFIIVTLILFAGIAFFHAIQGTFSALMMAVLTILAAAIAVNYYAPLSHALLLEQIPDYADACCLAGLFLVTLVVFRTLTDNLIRGNITFYPWVDRIIAAAISIPTALLLVGISSIAFQMLPFHEQVMLFNRFDDEGNRRSIFPRADDFAAGFMSMLSANSLSGRRQLGMLHPDWPAEVSAQRIAIQRESRHVVSPGTVKVTRAWKLETGLLTKKYSIVGRRYYRKIRTEVEKGKKRMPRPGHYYLAMTLQLKPEAADPDKYHRFAWGQVRLVGFLGHDLQRRYPINYYLIGFGELNPQYPNEYNYMRMKVPVLPKQKEDIEEEEPPWYRNYGVVSFQRVEGDEEFDVVFEVPEDFQPWFVEYKRWARAKVPKLAKSEEVPTREPGPGKEQAVKRVDRPGWHAQFQVDYDQTGFTEALPFRLSTAAARQAGAEISGSRYSRGTVHGWIGRNMASDLDSMTGGGLAGVVRRFDVPGGKALLRLECRMERAETKLLNMIFSSVQRVTQRYVVDKRGNRYMPVGQYVIASQDQGSMVELQYDPEFEQTMPKPFRHVQISAMRGRDVRVGFLFLVQPGAEMDRFELGGSPIEAQSLEGLAAP